MEGTGEWSDSFSFQLNDSNGPILQIKLFINNFIEYFEALEILRFQKKEKRPIRQDQYVVELLKPPATFCDL